MDTVEKIWVLCEPPISDMGMELVEVEHLGAPGGAVVRLYIDRNEGVSVGDCARVSREIGYLLDAEDVVRGRYFLEVSSPGIDRVLRKKEHFERFKGSPLRVVTKEPIQGARGVRGRIHACDDSTLYVETDAGSIVEVPLSLIERARLRGEIPFGAGGKLKKRGKAR
ncbi:MAG: ribosome maturation factor RimP [Candidatus Eisenbacteria bacterium]|nr:ribosome maturation factor RimP [Candidatus Eisenbacteria bacterium]